MKRLSFIVAAAAAVGSSLLGQAAWAATTFAKHRVSGMIVSVNGNTVVIERRNGSTVNVDLTEAIANSQVGVIAPSVKMVVHGRYNSDGSFHGVSTSHAGPNLLDWSPDE